MELIFVRHADAQSGAGYAEDGLRPLTTEGRRVQDRVGQALSRMGLRPDRVVCSPRLRAWETAEITCELLGCAEPGEWRVLDGGYAADALVDALRSLPTHVTVVCVGHEPDMSTWASELLCTGALRIKFPKSGVLGMSFDGHPLPGAGTLRYFYRPEDLAALVG